MFKFKPQSLVNLQAWNSLLLLDVHQNLCLHISQWIINDIYLLQKCLHEKNTPTIAYAGLILGKFNKFGKLGPVSEEALHWRWVVWWGNRAPAATVGTTLCSMESSLRKHYTGRLSPMGSTHLELLPFPETVMLHPGALQKESSFCPEFGSGTCGILHMTCTPIFPVHIFFPTRIKNKRLSCFSKWTISRDFFMHMENVLFF